MFRSWSDSIGFISLCVKIHLLVAIGSSSSHYEVSQKMLIFDTVANMVTCVWQRSSVWFCRLFVRKKGVWTCHPYNSVPCRAQGCASTFNGIAPTSKKELIDKVFLAIILNDTEILRERWAWLLHLPKTGL